MSTPDIWSLVVALLLVGVTAALAAAETGLAHVSRHQVDVVTHDGRRGAAGLAAVVADAAPVLTTLLLVRTVAETVAAALVAVVVVRELHGVAAAVGVAGVGLALLHFVVVGVAARTLGRSFAITVALRSAGPARAMSRVLAPVTSALIALGSGLVPGRVDRGSGLTTEAELRDLVDIAEAGKVIESGERAMIHSVFELGDTLVREVMVPRPDMVWIERDKTVAQALSLALRSGFSRIPVVGENADDIVGVAYLKDLVRRTRDADDRGGPVDSVMRSPYLVPDSKPADELLSDMQARRVHLAIVIDEYGGTAGLVTIEDILEEIVGEISDEYDRDSPRVQRHDDGSVRVHVRVPVDDLEEMFGVSFDIDDVETVGGLLAALLGRVPIPGATAASQGLTFVAEGATGRRNQVETVLVTPAPEPPTS